MKKRKQWLCRLLALMMVFTLAPGMAYGGLPGSGDEISSLEKFRELFYEEDYSTQVQGGDAGAEPERIYLDKSDGLHWERDYGQDDAGLPGPMSIVAANDDLSDQFTIGEERLFRAYMPAGNYRAIKAVLASIGEHTNVWVVDCADWHAAVGNVHNDATCKIPELMALPKVLQEVAITTDGIYKRMTDPVTGLAPHAGQLFLHDAANNRYVGDHGMDGKINILLSDTSGYWGYFESTDMRSNNLTDSARVTRTVGPLDVIHIDISTNIGWNALMEVERPGREKGDSLLFYGTIAHEFQHMLSQMYMWAHNAPSSMYWIDEALSGLVDIFYVQEGAEIIYAPYMEGAVRNSYAGTRGDFFAFGDDNKGYGVGYLHSMMMHKKTNGTYGSGFYSYIMSVGETPAEKRAFFTNSSNTMPSVFGAAFRQSLGDQYDGFTNVEVFNFLYYMFMEYFGADGGVVVSQAGEHNTAQKFIIPVISSDNLWVVRYYNAASSNRINPIVSGGVVALNGFQSNNPASPGRILAGASHEMIYRIGAAPDAVNTVLEIEIPNVPGLEYYVAIPNDTLGWERPLRSDSVFLTGATMHHMKKGQPNKVDTNGGVVFLYTTTLFRDVNTTVNFSWQAPDPDALAGSAAIDVLRPRYGDTLTAVISGANTTNLLYQWFTGGEAKGGPAADNTYVVATADIGKPISVKVTATDKAGAFFAATVPTLKAAYDGDGITAPELADKSVYTVELVAVEGFEYSQGGRLWQDSPRFAGLLAATEYDFYQRVKATETYGASPMSPALTEATVDKSVLEAPIEEAREIVASGLDAGNYYTFRSWKALLDALAFALGVMEDPDPSYRDVESAISGLYGAIENLAAKSIEAVTSSNGNKQANIDFTIRSANGKGYSVYIAALDADGNPGAFILADANFNNKGAHVKNLVNGVTYLAYIVYDEGGVYEESDIVVLEPR